MLSTLRLRGWKGVVRWLAGTCTLLGPEGPDNPCVALLGGVGGDGFSQTFTETSLCWWVWGFWPSVENYIVDASILETRASVRVSQKVNLVGSVAFRGGCLAGSLVNFVPAPFLGVGA